MAVTSSHIAANAITADKIGANEITVGKLRAGEITVDRLVTPYADNLVPNPNSDATAPLGGWLPSAYEARGIWGEPGTAYQGTYCRRLAATSTATATLTVTPRIPIAEGETVYAESMVAPWANAVQNGTNIFAGRMVIAWFNAAGTEIAWSFKDPTTAGSYQKIVVSATAPAGATAMCLRYEVAGQNATEATPIGAFIDNMVLRKTPPAIVTGINYSTGWGDWLTYPPPTVRALPGGFGTLTGTCIASTGAIGAMFTIPAHVAPTVSCYFPVRHVRNNVPAMVFGRYGLDSRLVSLSGIAVQAGDTVDFSWTFPLG